MLVFHPKQYLSLYLRCELETQGALLENLEKHKIG